MKAVILDIEGTTTPIDFVYRTLFPYARTELPNFLDKNKDTLSVSSDIELLRSEYSNEKDLSVCPVWSEGESALPYLLWLMDQDRKSPALKSLQGKIWESGYHDGALKGALFDDVVPALKRWNEQDVKIYIYSSGSVLAQKLLFSHSEYGDLTSLLSGYFDTGIGSKIQAKSYADILTAVEVENPKSVTFLSDNELELEAATRNGITVFLMVRPGNVSQTSAKFKSISSFEDTALSG